MLESPCYTKSMSTIQNRGFTIVELLIVIVVIAILAAISIVAYNGIQNRANDSTAQAELRGAATLMEEDKITSTDGEYVVIGSDIADMGIKFSHGAYDTSVNNLYICRSNSGDAYSITARSNSGNHFTVGSDSSVSEYTGGWGAANVCPSTGFPAGTYTANAFFAGGSWNWGS